MAVSGFAPSSGDLLIGSKYLLFNLAFLNFLQPTLPGLFEGNPINAVNGALWTVKVEVMFYAAVPIMVWLVHKFGRARTLAGLYVLGLVYFNALSHMASAAERPLFHELARQMPGQLPFFVAGMALYYYHSWFSERIRFLLPLAVLGLVTPSFLPLTPIYPASLAILVVTAALHLPRIVNLTAVGDLSFGIYGLHFPILQALVAAGVFAGDGFALLSAGAALAILSAWFSWRVIERPFLRGSRHFRGAQARRRMPVTPSAVGASHSPG